MMAVFVEVNKDHDTWQRRRAAASAEDENGDVRLLVGTPNACKKRERGNGQAKWK